MPTPTTFVNQYPATSGFIWGCPTPETGFSVESVDENVTTDVFEQRNNVGEFIEVVAYNARTEMTVNGEVLGTFAGVVGHPITIANLSLIGYPTGSTAGLVLLRSARLTQNRTANKRISMTATMYPLIPAS
jgi:hypothetical protein